MHKTLKFFTIFLSLIILSGCSSLSGLKFWGDDEEEIELPAVLEEITQKISISSLWDASHRSAARKSANREGFYDAKQC